MGKVIEKTVLETDLRGGQDKTYLRDIRFPLGAAYRFAMNTQVHDVKHDEPRRKVHAQHVLIPPIVDWGRHQNPYR